MAVILAIVVVAAGVLYAYVWSDRGKAVSVTLGPAGGRIGPGGDLGQLDVPAGTVSSSTTVTFSTKLKAPADTIAAVAMPIGGPVRISPSRALPGAKIRLPLDAGDLPTSDGHRATTANAFIAVYNTTLRMWVPLATSYDPGAHQLVATAPHFSLFGRFVVDPAKAIWNTTINGIQALGRAALDALSGAGSALSQMFNGEQKDVSCPDRQPGWAVISSVSEVAGSNDDKTSCVQPTPDGAALRLRSTLRVPFQVVLPHGVTTPRADYDNDATDLVSLLGQGMARTIGTGYLPPRGRTELHLSAEDSQPGTNVTVRLEPDELPLAIGVILGLLAIIPGEATFTHSIETNLVFREKALELTKEGLTSATYEHRLMLLITETLAQKDEFDHAELIGESVDCVTSTLGARSETSGDGKSETTPTSAETLTKDAISLAKKCAGLAISGYKQKTGQDIGELTSVITGIPDAVQSLGSVWDAIRLGATHWAGQFDVTAEHGFGLAPAPTDSNAPLADGDLVANVSAVSSQSRQLRLDKVDYFDAQVIGTAAVKAACQADHVQVPPEIEECNEFYIRNSDKTTHVVTIGANASLQVEHQSKSGSLVLVATTIDGLKQSVDDDKPLILCHVTIQRGQVTALSQIYLP